MPASKSERTMTWMPALTVRAAVIAVLAGLLGGCDPDNQCVGGQFRCDGDVAMNCANLAGRHKDYDVWYATECGAGKCKLDTTSNAAFCARDAAPDPRCDEQRRAFCDGTTLTSCRKGYVVATKDCATTDPDPKVCVPLGSADVGPYPLNAMCANATEPSSLCRATSTSDTCDGDEVVVCQHGYEIARVPCGAGLTCRNFGVCSS